MVKDQNYSEKGILKPADSDHNESNLLSLVKECYQSKKYSEALKYLTILTANFPNKSEYHSGIAIVQKYLGNYKEAENSYKKAIEIDPVSYEAYYNLGILTYEQHNIDKAIKYFWKAVEIKPDMYLAYYNLGNAYREKKNFNLSVDCYLKTIDINKEYDDAHYNLGVVWEKKRELDKAIECYEKAILYNPGNLNARWNLALLYLQTGNLVKGWIKYEVRKDRNGSGKRNYCKPELKSEHLNGKRILVYSEQGLGDTIQFARYLEMLKSSGAYVIFVCLSPLAELFKKLDGVDELIPECNYIEKDIDYDYHVSLLSLPLYFNTTLENIPARIPYISADREKVYEWKEKIKSSNYINIGIAWAGAETNITGKDRSCSLNDFLPLFSIAGVKFFSLQKLRDKDEKINADFPVVSFDGIDCIPFRDTAAIIENLDLVISIDTSIAHLAGALGKTVWTLLPYYSDWRWLLNRNDSLWYPTMKLFRQPDPDEWSKVFSEVADEIQKFIILKSQNTSLI